MWTIPSKYVHIKMCPIFSGCGDSCLNVTPIKLYTKSEVKTNYLLIAFIGYINDLNKLQQLKVSVQKSHIDFNALFIFLSNSTCSSPEVILAFLLYEGGTIHNASDQFVSLFMFLCRLRFASIPTDKNLITFDLYSPASNSCVFTPIENWTHVYMNLFTRNSPYSHLQKYLLFLLKHSV